MPASYHPDGDGARAGQDGRIDRRTVRRQPR